MSDSLKATVICRALVSMISAKAEELLELELELELDPPRLPADVAPPAPLLLDDDPLPDAELAPELVPAETLCPGCSFDSETIVPLAGAVSFVAASDVSAVLRFDSALYTDACAEAIAACEVLVVVLVVATEPPEALGALLPPDALGEPLPPCGVTVRVTVVTGPEGGPVRVDVRWAVVVVVRLIDAW
ncbi:MAG TPA: hypothetical protein VLP43_12315 [Solirubrobacteraceae bacterium]|nr:hypothetical protein [Solirubrobacteraceae bacterium]